MNNKTARKPMTFVAAVIASMGFSNTAWSENKIQELATGDSGFTFEVIPSMDSSFILTAAEDNVVRLWNLGASETMTGFRGHEDWVNSIALSENGELVASASYDQTIRIWDVSSGAQVQKMPFQDDQAHDVTFDPTGTLVAAATDTGVHLWSIATGELLRTLSTGERHHATSVSFSPDGLAVVAGTRHWDFQSNREAGRSFLWNVDQAEPVAWYDFQEDGIVSAVFAPDGDHVLSTSEDGTVKLWATEFGGEVRELELPNNSYYQATFSADGSRILVFETLRRFSVWNASTLEQLTAFDYEPGIEAIAFGPDGETVVFSTTDGAIRQFSIAAVQ